MLGQRFPEKNKVGLLALVSTSVIFSAVLSIGVYEMVIGFLGNRAVNTLLIPIILSLSIVLAVIAILTILGLFINKALKERTYLKELKSFKNFVAALHRSITEEEIYKVLYDFLTHLPNITHVTVFYEDDGTTGETVWKKISDEKQPLCETTPENCPLVGLGYECWVRNIEKNIICVYQSPKYKSGSYICAPIMDSGHIQSILQVYSDSPNYFDASRIGKIKSYIEIIKPVINSRRTLHILNKTATTDKLTKLYNRSFLDPYLENQIETAKLSNQPLSVIMIDIDHFKNINDSYGHSVGDSVLSLFSEQLLKCMRKSDLVARYGGEEFIVVLPSTDTETAAGVAERIRETVANTAIPPFDGYEIPPITCSLGISTYPLYCSSKDTLIKTSDAALYTAKQSGRNCTKVYNYF